MKNKIKVFEDVDRIKITEDDTIDIEEKINSLENYDLSLSNYLEFFKDVSSILNALNDLIKARLASLSKRNSVLDKILNSPAFERYRKNIEDTIIYRIYQKLEEKNDDLLYLVTYLYFSTKLYALQHAKSSKLLSRVKDRELELLKLKDNYNKQKEIISELQRKIEEFENSENNIENLKEKLKSKEEEIEKLKNQIKLLELEKKNQEIFDEEIFEKKFEKILSKFLIDKGKIQRQEVEEKKLESKLESKSELESESKLDSDSNLKIEILKMISENPKISKRGVAEKLNLEFSQIEKIFDELKKEKKIKRFGPRWIVLDENDREID